MLRLSKKRDHDRRFLLDPITQPTNGDIAQFGLCVF